MDINVQNTVHQAMSALGAGNADKTLAQSAAALRTVKDADKIEAAAKEFEAVFLSQMMSHMFESIETDPMFGGGQAEGIYRSMMIQEYGKAMAEAGGIGISDVLKQELIAMQEGNF